jgi:catechol 2,3-dioxygenase-like lactoylglutathione lyase family enzyme
MLTAIIPKLPMRDPATTRAYYVDQLGFTVEGEYDDYLIVERDGVELHFFLYPEIDPRQNYGQVYIRVNAIDTLYGAWNEQGVRIHPNAAISDKPWGQREFAVLDPDHNLLTFGQAL